MKIRGSKEGHVILEEVFSGVELITSDGENMGICMRDTGFEFSYQGVWYSAKNGILEPMKTSDRGNVLVDQSDKDDACSPGPRSADPAATGN